MHSSTLITALLTLLTLLTLASTAPTTSSAQARDVPVLDVFITEATQDSHAIQVELGVLKVCIGDNGFAPCLATELAISPNGADIDITLVECEAFTDTAGAEGIGSFTSSGALDFGGLTDVGSVSCGWS